MRTAPAVSVCSDGGPVWSGLQWLLPAGAVLSLSVWALQWLQLAPFWAALPALGVLVGCWRSARPLWRCLNWDAQVWTVDGRAVELRLMVDLGFWLLLRSHPLTTDDKPQWLPVSRAHAGAALPALRAAVVGARPEPHSGGGFGLRE